MSSLRPLVAALLSMMVTAPLVIACSADTSDDDQASAPTDDEIKSGGGLGAKCTEGKKCKTGLNCDFDKVPSSSSSGGPPPGAMGMPVSSSSSGGPPPGAMGLPLRVGVCSEPEPGTEGGECSSSIKCHAGLHCDYLANASGAGDGRPVMGMPIRKDGKCKKAGGSSGGPPPGTMGMPLHP